MWNNIFMKKPSGNLSWDSNDGLPTYIVYRKCTPNIYWIQKSLWDNRIYKCFEGLPTSFSEELPLSTTCENSFSMLFEISGKLSMELHKSLMN